MAFKILETRSPKPMPPQTKGLEINEKLIKQTGKIKSIGRDLKRIALPPGKRVSKSGKTYYEKRRNRSDINGGI